VWNVSRNEAAGASWLNQPSRKLGLPKLSVDEFANNNQAGVVGIGRTRMLRDVSQLLAEKRKCSWMNVLLDVVNPETAGLEGGSCVCPGGWESLQKLLPQTNQPDF
jgi:hypothetical protein